MFKRFNIYFVIVFTITIFIAFGIHIYILNLMSLPMYGNLICEAYLANYILAIIIYFSLFLLKRKFNDQLGFIYMIGSFLKFAIFFVIFYPLYNQDGTMHVIEFLTFFIPYAISLTAETVAVIKLVNK